MFDAGWVLGGQCLGGGLCLGDGQVRFGNAHYFSGFFADNAQVNFKRLSVSFFALFSCFIGDAVIVRRLVMVTLLCFFFSDLVQCGFPLSLSGLISPFKLMADVGII